MRIVFLSHTAPTGVFKIGSHHLSREFADLGHDVYHISSPVSLAHLARVKNSDVRRRLLWALLGPRVDKDGVTQLVPFTLVPTAWLGERGRRAALSMSMVRFNRLKRNLHLTDVMFLDQPTLVELAEVLHPNVMVYRPTDVHFESTQRTAELKAISIAHAVVATSQHVLDEVTRSTRQLPTMVLENGVEYGRFSEVALTPSDRNGFVYVGALDERFDMVALASMAKSMPSEPFKIAGPMPSAAVRDGQPSNVHFVGPIPYDDVPAFLSKARVGLLPMSTSPANSGRSPMKYYEYLASGLTVAATTSPALVDRKGPGVFLYDGTDPAAAARCARDAHASAVEVNIDGRKFASGYSWAARAQELAQFVGSL